MSETTYQRTWPEVAYNNIYQLLTAFKTEEVGPRVAASSVVEKISAAVSALVKTEKVPAVLEADGSVKTAETTKQIFPASITVTLTRGELDGITVGIKEWLKKSEVTAEQILLLKAISKSFGIFNRFAKHLDTILADMKVDEDLDPEIEEPLDAVEVEVDSGVKVDDKK